MPNDWKKLAADQLTRVANWQAGKGWTLHPKETA
jgi:hypothetical protein